MKISLWQKVKNIIKKNTFIWKIIVAYKISKNNPTILKRISKYLEFLKELKKFKKADNPNYLLNLINLKPCLFDKTETQLIDPVYFYQDTWCAQKIFSSKVDHHYDIGSNTKSMAIISQLIPTTMVDIRPIDLELSNFYFKKGSILNLPFTDGSLQSVSSICVIEHIGLGRYGDDLDPFGSEKSCKELIRVLAKNGNLYITVPVDDNNKIYFNAHRAFTREYILKQFTSLRLVEEKYIYGRKLFNNYNKDLGFGTGMYHFCNDL